MRKSLRNIESKNLKVRSSNDRNSSRRRLQVQVFWNDGWIRKQNGGRLEWMDRPKDYLETAWDKVWIENI
jgi:hypothetical protein